jgi:hypothetical protein
MVEKSDMKIVVNLIKLITGKDLICKPLLKEKIKIKVNES